MARKRKVHVLFLCIGNACRSPMAESVALHHANDIIEPSSAGLRPFGSIIDSTTQVLLANGYSVDTLTSKLLTPDSVQNTDLIINMTGMAHDALFPGSSKVEDWLVQDPYGADHATYQKILEEIETRVLLLAARLRGHRKLPKSRSKRSSVARG